MKKLISASSLFLCCLAASAQPTSFGGVTPGKTTREELKSLVKEPQKVGAEDFALGIQMKQPEGISASFHLLNDVVYKVSVSLNFQPELGRALIEKYGDPSIKVGGLRAVTCKNQFGASFLRIEGNQELRWEAKDGIQGVIRRFAGDCAEKVFQSYELRHLETITAIEGGQAEKARKDAEDARRKLGGAY